MKKITYLFIAIIFVHINLYSQNDSNHFYFASWNVENLFDTIDDPDKNDQEFTPDSDKKWTEKRLSIKLDNIAKVISSMNNNLAPDLMAFQEVEHETLIDSLIKRMPMKNYKSVYFESPDNRGIDNCLIYDANRFNVLHELKIEVHLGGNRKTRDIVYAQLEDVNKNIFNVFVNHWPSRLGGQDKSEPLRIIAAKTLHNNIQDILAKDKNANIICLGDFNDEPDNISIADILSAYKYECNENIINEYSLINMSYFKFSKGEGTIKYQGKFNLIDQLIISKGLFNRISSNDKCSLYSIYNPNWMLTKEGNFKGAAIPTYGGKKYMGGYSDHLPITFEFSFE